MKFIHTADWQIGMLAAQFGTEAERVREARFAPLDSLVSVARERAAKVIGFEGYVFDDLALPKALVQCVARTTSYPSCRRYSFHAGARHRNLSQTLILRRKRRARRLLAPSLIAIGATNAAVSIRHVDLRQG